MGIEGIWGKDRGKHGVKAEGNKSEDRRKQRRDTMIEAACAYIFDFYEKNKEKSSDN